MYIKKTSIIEKPIQFSGIVKVASLNGIIQTSDIITSDEGIRYYKFTDEILNQYINYGGGNPSFVERALVIFHQNGKTEINLNNFEYSIKVKNKFYKNINDIVLQDDITGIEEVIISNFNIPIDSGIILQLSWNGKKCIYYDVTPIALKAKEYQTGIAIDKKRVLSYEKMTAVMLSHIAFMELFWITEEEWNSIMKIGWFPFAFLQGDLWKETFKLIKNQQTITTVDNIYEKLIQQKESKIALWAEHPILKNEIDFIKSAFQAYESNNWIGVSSIIGPRIEGVMTSAIGKFMKHSKLLDGFGEKLLAKEHNKSILFPEKFENYCKSILFKDVNMMNSNIDSAGLNRHLLAHGRVKSDFLNKEVATIRFLLLDHISYYYPPI